MKSVFVALAAGMMALGGFADEAKPLLGGFHPDPSVCRGADGAYYLVTSSFMWTPGLPVYRSEDFRTWTFVGHVLFDAHFAKMRGTADLTENDGIWAPTLRYARGRYWVVVSFHGKAAVLYRNVDGILAWTNDGPQTATFRLKSEDGMSVGAFRDGQPFGEPRPLLPLVEAGRKTRFNGPGVGIR